MMALIFICDPRSGHVQVKKGQISKLKNFFSKNMSSFFPDSQNVTCFDVRQLQMPKNAIQRSDVITFAWFFGHCKARNKGISLKFCTLIVGLYFYTFILFFGYLQNFDFVCIYFQKNQNFDLWKSKTKGFENPRQPFYRAFNLASLRVFCLRFASKLYILEGIESWPFFTQSRVT